MSDYSIFEAGDVVLQSGLTYRGARLAYKTHGELNEAKDNVVLFPHMWSGTPKAMEIFIGRDRPLDPGKYFIVLPGQFANGFSMNQLSGTIKRRRSQILSGRNAIFGSFNRYPKISSQIAGPG